MKRVYFYLLIVLMLVSCKSAKKIGSSGSAFSPDTDYLETVLYCAPSFRALTAKMKLDIQVDGQDISVNGNLRMKKDEVIQLSIVPLLGIEVAKIDITPERILLLDRFNKQYVEVPIEELRTLMHTDLDFYSLQALFFNELFVPGKKKLDKELLRTFTLSKRDMQGETILQIQGANHFIYRFTTLAAEGRLIESSILARGEDSFSWKYADFRPLAGKDFPSTMNMALKAGRKSLKAGFGLSRMSTKADWESRTPVPKKYKPMDIQELLKQLLGL